VYLTSCPALSSDHPQPLIDTACRSSFYHKPDHPDFRRTDRAKFQTHLEELIPFDPELHNEMAIDTCVENFSGAVLKALAASAPKRRPRDNPGLRYRRHSGWDSLKTRLRSLLQITRDPALKAEVNRLQISVTRRLNVWRNYQWSATLESWSWRTIDVEDDQAGDESSYSIPPYSPKGDRSQALTKPKPL